MGYKLLSQTAFWQVNKKLAKATSNDAAIFLSFLVDTEEYLLRSDKVDNDGFFSVTIKTIEENCNIMYHSQKVCRKELGKVDNGGKGFITEKRKGIPAKTYYKLDKQAISEFLFSTVENDKLELRNQQTVQSKSTNSVVENDKQCSRNQQTLYNNTINNNINNNSNKGETDKNKVLEKSKRDAFGSYVIPNSLEKSGTIPFEDFIELYAKKTTMTQSRMYWLSLSEEVQNEVMASLQNGFLEAYPEIQYRPHPYNYLFNSLYKDDYSYIFAEQKKKDKENQDKPTISYSGKLKDKLDAHRKNQNNGK